ncbi:hypothetical protein DF185_15055 [Marinifilum breve]|uniref:Uncharacterized protein n=1 Tax=Marinifilum breve TaxID=2184082 RepID=A0A2V4A9A7_9BACT|nr:hypothetical protein [Marinifilum breve]PXX99192.1 hypothetical protein DF185_15055 [Marinifilum breve]
MTKKNRIVSFKKRDSELMNLIQNFYPYGFEDDIKFYQLGPDKSFYAFPISTEECNILVKVDVDYDFNLDMEDE